MHGNKHYYLAPRSTPGALVVRNSSLHQHNSAPPQPSIRTTTRVPDEFTCCKPFNSRELNMVLEVQNQASLTIGSVAIPAHPDLQAADSRATPSDTCCEQVAYGLGKVTCVQLK